MHHGRAYTVDWEIFAINIFSSLHNNEEKKEVESLVPLSYFSPSSCGRTAGNEATIEPDDLDLSLHYLGI